MKQTKEVYNLQRKQYYYDHLEKIRAQKRAWTLQRKKMVLDHYGGHCVCCGEVRFEFLCIDHIAGGGNKHKRARNNMPIYGWLVKNNFPEGFRILCWNCNSSMGAFGYCPHQREEQ